MSDEQKKKIIKDLPLHRMIPNMVTLLALASGVTSIRLSCQEKWEYAIIALLLAAIFDGLDGRVARLLNGTTRIGAELDSLSDFVSFGVAPAIFLFFWSMKEWRGVGWILALVYAMCCAYRLARFNTMLDDDEERPAYWGHFFLGLPAPGGAGLVFLPALLYLAFPGTDVFRSPYVNGIFLLFCGFLMASRIPTPSLKKMRIPVKYFFPVFLFVIFFAAAVVSEFWKALAFLSLFYLANLPLGFIRFRKMSRQEG